MSVTSTPVFPQSISSIAAQITNSTGTGTVTVASAGANGSKIEALSVSNTDTAAHDVQFFLNVSSVAYLLTTISIPASAGNIDSTPAVDILRSAQWPGLAYDTNGNKVLYLANGATITAAVTVAAASGKTVNFIGHMGNF